MMTQYQQATVRLVGRVQSVDDNTATLLTSDGKTVVVHRGNGGRYTDEIVEVVGQVNGDSLTEAAVYGFGDAETFCKFLVNYVPVGMPTWLHWCRARAANNLTCPDLT